jgi:alanyl-tRNA synthetase
LAVEPRVLLLDEPFGALDAKVRRDLRRWLKDLHQRIRVTCVLVTHDQEEALEVADKIEQAQRRVKDLERALEEARGKLAAAQSGDLAAQAREVNGAKVLATRVQGDAKALRELADKLRDKLARGVVALGAEVDGKAVLLVAVTKDLVGKVKAGDLVKEAAKLVGGAGGGKPDMAQAGGSNPAGLDQALEKVVELATKALG